MIPKLMRLAHLGTRAFGTFTTSLIYCRRTLAKKNSEQNFRTLKSTMSKTAQSGDPPRKPRTRPGQVRA